MYKKYIKKHNVFGDIMFYFIINVILYVLLILFLYHYYSKRRITILNFLIMLFLLNIYFVLLYNDINIIVGILITLIIFLIERFYNYVYFRYNKIVDKEKVLVKNGNINFKGLIENKYSYNKLINNLRRRGIKDISKIDYCALYNNDLIIFSSNIKSYPVNLIVDGKIIYNNLFALNKDKDWLVNSLNDNNLIIKDVSYAFYKDNQLYFLTNV